MHETPQDLKTSRRQDSSSSREGQDSGRSIKLAAADSTGASTYFIEIYIVGSAETVSRPEPREKIRLKSIALSLFRQPRPGVRRDQQMKQLQRSLGAGLLLLAVISAGVGRSSASDPGQSTTLDTTKVANP